MTMQLIPIIRRHWRCVSNLLNTLHFDSINWSFSECSVQLFYPGYRNGSVDQNLLQPNVHHCVSSLKNKWETEIEAAESDRLSNPAGMDIMGAKETDLNPDPTPSRLDVGHSGLQWVALAISIEERQ